MATTTFVNGVTVSDEDWFNDVDRLVYDILGDVADMAALKLLLHAAPGAIGGGTPAAGAFTTLTASSTLFVNTGAGIGVAQSATTALNLSQSSTGVSSIRIAHGTAPSAPVNGDAWTTTGGAFIQINGVTKQFTLT